MRTNRRLLFTLFLALLTSFSLSACDRSDSTEATAETEAAQVQDAPSDTEAAEDTADAELDPEDLPFYATGPIARVNGEELPADEFNQLVAEQVQRLNQALPPEMVAMLQNQTVERMIDIALIDAVLEAEDISATAEEVDEYFQQFASQFPDEATMQQFLDEQGATVEKVKESMFKDVALEKYLATQHDLEVTDAEIQTFFDENREDLNKPRRAHTRHIILRVPQGASPEETAEVEARIQEIHQQLADDNSNFEALAREYSESPTSARGGDLGPLYEPQMTPGYAAAAFELEPGQVSEPVKSRFGFHIIQLLEKEDSEPAVLENIQDDLRQQIRHQKRGEAFQLFLADARENAEIEKLPENITSRVTSAPPSQPQMPALTPPATPQPTPSTAGPGGDSSEGLQLQLDPSLQP